jgi:DNA-binding XRE family transcriptional regulator
MNNQKLGEALRTLRHRRKLTQEEVAQKVEVKRPAYTAWENGTSNPSIEDAISLAILYEVEIEDIINFGTTLPEDKHLIDNKILMATTQSMLASDSSDSDEVRKIEQVIALMEDNMFQLVLLAYGERLDDVRVQKEIMYAMAIAKRDATLKIQRKINAITANAGNNGL